MLEKQVGLLNGELKALKSVNDMLKKSLINVVGPRSKLMNDIEIATRRILHQQMTNTAESNLRQNPLSRKLNRPTPPPPPQQAQAECSNFFQENGQEFVAKNKENLNNIPIPGNFRPIQSQRKLNRPTPPPPQHAQPETSEPNKVVVANVKVPNSNRQKVIPLNKLPADKNRPPTNVIGQKRSRQTASPDIVVVDLETKVEASSPQPSYQQRLQSLADQQKSTNQNVRSITPTNSSTSPPPTTEVICTDSTDNETEFFIGEDHSPDSELRQGYIYCETY